MCGIGGVIGSDTTATDLVELGVAVANRGRSAFGMVTLEKGCVNPHTWRRKGSITRGIPFNITEEIPGDMGMVHTRYGTNGSNGSSNWQPGISYNRHGITVIGHNGNMDRAATLRNGLLQIGGDFRSDSDTEIIHKLIAKSRAKTFVGALRGALKKVGISFCLLIMREDGMYAVRDPSGNRRLFMLETATATYFASEDPAFENLPDGKISEIQPGEMIFVSRTDPGRAVRKQLLKRADRLSICSFETVYFGRPDTSMPGGETHGLFRYACGVRLSSYFDLSQFDEGSIIISAVPSSGSDAANGFAAGLKYSTVGAVKRNHYIIDGTVDRGFTGDDEKERAKNAEHKFLVNKSFVRGKDVILVDDSLVRGTTLQRLISKVRAKGARSVHVVIASPPVVGQCPLGISIRSQAELIAPGKSIEEIASFIGADSLLYLEQSDYLELLAEYGMPEVCDGCFTLDYPEAMAA